MIEGVLRLNWVKTLHGGTDNMMYHEKYQAIGALQILFPQKGFVNLRERKGLYDPEISKS